MFLHLYGIIRYSLDNAHESTPSHPPSHTYPLLSVTVAYSLMEMSCKNVFHLLVIKLSSIYIYMCTFI